MGLFTRKKKKAKATKPTDPVKEEKVDDKYLITSVILGQGQSGVVKLGRLKKTKEKVAIKCVNRYRLDHEDEVGMQQEIAYLKKLDHPNIIKMLDLYIEDDMYYIVTEFAAGGELFDRIVKRKAYTEDNAREAVRTIAKALKYCHDKGIVHRDIKPENILLANRQSDHDLKLADFGFAKSVLKDIESDTNPAKENPLYTSCGTPAYCAPEIIRKKPYGKECDVWSFGVVTYILLCGYPPFYAANNENVLFKMICKGNFKFDPQYWDKVSQDAKDLISNMLVVDQSKRFTIDQVLAHKWITDETRPKSDLTPVLKDLRLYQARRRWKIGTLIVDTAMEFRKLGKRRARKRVQKASDAGTINTNFSDADAEEEEDDDKLDIVQQIIEENQAAVTLQSAFRGARLRLAKSTSRQDLDAKRASTRVPTETAAVNLAFGQPAAAGDDNGELTGAATKVQSVFRGAKARKEQQKEAVELGTAATKVQAVFRGKLARKEQEQQPLTAIEEDVSVYKEPLRSDNRKSKSQPALSHAQSRNTREKQKKLWGVSLRGIFRSKKNI